MAKYEVLVETLGANPTYSKGDIIDDDGQAKAYDFAWLEESGAVKKLSKRDLAAKEQPDEMPTDEQTPASATPPEAGPDMVVPGEQMPKDDKPSPQTRHR